MNTHSLHQNPVLTVTEDFMKDGYCFILSCCGHAVKTFITNEVIVHNDSSALRDILLKSFWVFDKDHGVAEKLISQIGKNYEVIDPKKFDPPGWAEFAHEWKNYIDEPKQPTFVGSGTRDSGVDKLPALKQMVKNPVTGKEEILEFCIISLNDQQRWTREQIADWLETLDIDIRFQTGKEESDDKVRRKGYLPF